MAKEANPFEFKCNLLPLRHVLCMCELSLKSKPFLVVISFNLLFTSHSFVDVLRSSLCPSSFSLRSMSIPCCCKNSVAFVWLKEAFVYYIWSGFLFKNLLMHSSQKWNIPVLVPSAIAEIFFSPLISIEVKKSILDKKTTPQFTTLPFPLVCVCQCPWCS